MSDPLPNVTTVRALPGHRLAVGWRDGSHDVVDFRAVLTSHPSLHPSFVPLRDEAAFAQVHVADWGGGIEWESGADYAADALRALASQQRGSGAAPRPETLEGVLAGYDAAEVNRSMRTWLDDAPKGKERL